MTEPKENEEINEELSTDDLKSVSGGIYVESDSTLCSFSRSPHGFGSGVTQKDWKKRTQSREGMLIDGNWEMMGE
ncbi:MULTISPECIES: hypothetical protein [Prochlorococcus]|uniref:hypothetical protein n=1 Tax=Prochlorococcus TaxID=1218 RepID=UPI0007B3BA1B|nr:MULTISPECIES: hypothetical protein [Prochlorococcus]KZR66449.1 hypothetical protein PMIT1312_00914 [Prochlorococcus marinus str. MIT 1312]NMO83156.1 hypothetical protein [Prochlorococcus sp. P1344]NMP12303.1 hypothetical protein [Prochlorococcus sp.P1363]